MSFNIAIWALFGLIGGATGAATYPNPQSSGANSPSYGSAQPNYGSAQPGYGSAQPNYGSAPSDSGYNGAASTYGSNGAEAELDNLKSQIGSLEGRRDAQVYRLRNLAASAGANVEGKNNYIKFIGQQIINEQNIQAKRLDSLAEKIAAIRKLREVIKQLDADANTVKDFNQKVRLDDFEDQIRKLKQTDLRQNGLIEELNVRAANEADRIDALVVSSNSELRDLTLLESQTRRAINSINRVKSTSFSLTVSPNKPNPAKVIYNQEFLGVPQFFSYDPVGFKLVRKNAAAAGYQGNYGNSNNGYSNYGSSNSGYSNYGSSSNGYNNGGYSNNAGYSAYPGDSSVSYHIESLPYNDFAAIYTYDESIGDYWVVDSVDLRATAIYFEPNLLPRVTG